MFHSTIELSNERLTDLMVDILKVGETRLRRDEFYSLIELDWKQKYGQLPPKTVFREVIRKMRLIGVLDRTHNHATRLGKFILIEDLQPFSLLSYLQEKVPQLFNFKILNVPERLFSEVSLFVCEWYSDEKNYEYTPRKVEIFQYIVKVTFRVGSLPKDLEEKDNLLKATLLQRINNQEDIPCSPSLEALASKPRGQHKGKATKQVLIDIYTWMENSKEENTACIYKAPFYKIREFARQKPSVNEASYTRAVTRIVKRRRMTSKDLQYFQQLGKLPEIDLSAIDIVKKIRTELKVSNLRFNINNVNRCLVFKDFKVIGLPFDYLKRTCAECLYLEGQRKRDCLLFKRIEIVQNKTKLIPAIIKPIYNERIDSVFSAKVACPFWRTKKPMKGWLQYLENQQLHCVHCQKPLLRTPQYKSVKCKCETNYRFVSSKDSENGVYEYQLTKRHNMNHDLAIINPRLPEIIEKTVSYQPELEINEKQWYDPKKDGVEHLLKSDSNVVYIKESDDINYDKVQDRLIVEQKVFDLAQVSLIDAQLISGIIQDITHDHPHLKINYRPHQLAVSIRDEAYFEENEKSGPSLNIIRRGIKEPKSYPLHKIALIYNIGKPRLNPLLKEWGVEVLYFSIKGLKSQERQEKEEIISEALDLPGVLDTINEIQLLGVVLSTINATLQLIGISEKYGEKQLVDRFTNQIRGLINDFPRRLVTRLAEERTSSRDFTLIKGWFLKLFTEGVRTFMKRTQDPNYPMLDKPINRMYATRIKKSNKDPIDYMGGYTPLDSALNCGHRLLRYRLQNMNVQAGLGLGLFPLFDYQTGNELDRPLTQISLEKVGRMATNLEIAVEVVERRLGSNHFKRHYDDNLIPYYVPSTKFIRSFKGEVIDKTILSTDIYYNQRWMPFRGAYQRHVRHLSKCLRECMFQSDRYQRRKFLLETYRPLIYSPRTYTDMIALQGEIIELFLENWIRKTHKLLQERKTGKVDLTRPLINSELIHRCLEESMGEISL